MIEAYITDSKKFLKGDVPDDTARFITTAGTSYAAAGKAPFAPKLTKRGYPATRLATLLDNLDDLTGTAGEQDTATGDAMEDTAERDAAYAKLKEFMKELKGTARGALRNKSGLLAKLEMRVTAPLLPCHRPAPPPPPGVAYHVRACTRVHYARVFSGTNLTVGPK